MLVLSTCTITFRRLSKSRSFPPRPPPAKTGPGRPPPPSLQARGRASTDASKKQKPHRKSPVLPPRPNPGHRLYNKYTVSNPTVQLLTASMWWIPLDIFFIFTFFNSSLFLTPSPTSVTTAAVEANSHSRCLKNLKVSGLLECGVDSVKNFLLYFSTEKWGASAARRDRQQYVWVPGRRY